MNIRGNYSGNEAVLRKEFFNFDIGAEGGVNFHIKKAPYYHSTVTIYNPMDERMGHFSFKSRNNRFYISKSIVAGRWRMEITNTMELQGEFDIEITQGKRHPDAISLVHEKRDFNRIYNSEKRWYSGDFHMHTNFSDGSYNLDQVVKKCIKQDLDIIAITDHNVMHTEMPGTPLPILPSTELTLDDKGHFNFHGLEEEFDFTEVIDVEKTIPEIMEEFLKRAREKNIITCLNHPFAQGTALLYDISIENISIIEIIRSPFKGNNNTTNNMAIKAFDYLWKRGYRIYGVGGSDSHGERNSVEEVAGLPVTALYLDGLSIGNALEAMKEGKTYMTVDTNIELKISSSEGKKILPGEMVDKDVRYKITGEEAFLWNTIMDGEIVDSKQGKDMSVILKLETGQYGRVEGRDKEGNIRVFINPNYRSGGKKTGTSWGEVRDFIVALED